MISLRWIRQGFCDGDGEGEGLPRARSIVSLSCALVVLWAGLAVGQPPAKSEPQSKQPAAKTPPQDVQPPKVQPPQAKKPAAKQPATDAASEPAPKLAPPTPAPQPRPRRTTTSDSMRSPILRLASVPNMFGDLFNQTGQVQINGAFGAIADIPTAGVLGRSKVSENNKAVTMDRVYFMVNHFHNALEADFNTRDQASATSYSVERYTLGLEKRFLDDRWSVDLRLPLVSGYDFGISKFGVAGGELGNLSVILKRQLLANCTTGVVAGLGIDIPTGDDMAGHAATTNFWVQNDAVHLSPYVGLMRAPNSCFFYHGFLQLDVPLNGNGVAYADPYFNTAGQFGRLNEQTLLHCDVSAGRWIYRNRCAPLVTGLASVVELHYSTTLQDADVVYGAVAPLSYQFGNVLSRVDAVQCTVGLHANLGPQTTFRVGGAFPLNSGQKRPFDAEVLVSLNRRF